MADETPPRSELLLYQTEDGRTRIQGRFADGTIWLTQAQMAELFQTSVPSINLHLKAIYAKAELTEAATLKPYLLVRTEGTRQVSRHVMHYSLPVIIAVGSRLRSQRGAQFCEWATARLTEYLVKGFTMDDDYFDELLERIRDIRASERRMYLRVQEVLALAADYTPTEPEPPLFYLHEDEITELNRIVVMLLDFAEYQARRRKQIFLKDWKARLDDFLRPRHKKSKPNQNH